MMRNHRGGLRGFINGREAWYSKFPPLDSEDEDVSFGIYHEGGGTTGEIQMVWIDQGDGKKTPRLVCDDDAWDALGRFLDVTGELAKYDSENISVDKFCEILLKCGLDDLTPRDNPHK